MLSYTPKEVAMFLKIADLPYTKEREMIQMIAGTELTAFEKSVDNELEKLDEGYPILNEQQEALRAYFKVIKLRLLYQNECQFVRLKLRTILKEFKYKRRSEKLMNEIQNILDEFELKTYLKGHMTCSVKEIDLDDFIMIRLKSENNLNNT